MRPRGRTWGLALTALACSTAVGLSACGSGTDEPPGATAGDVAPIGELAGPTVRLDSGAGFDNLLAVTVDTSGEGVTLIAGQVELARGGAPEVRIVVDGQTAEDDTVTLRDRDTLEQTRVPIAGLGDDLAQRLREDWRSPKLER